MTTRIKTLAVLTAAAAISSAASAQTYTFTQTELGRIVPARFVTTTQALMANVDLAVVPAVVPAAVSADASDVQTSALLAGEDVSTWNAVAAADDDEENTNERDEQSFFGTTMGRASIVGLAGLAGASYFALRGESAATETRLTDAAGVTALPAVAPAFTENPEPASMALMGLGLVGLAVVARRRRTN